MYINNNARGRVYTGSISSSYRSGGSYNSTYHYAQRNGLVATNGASSPSSQAVERPLPRDMMASLESRAIFRRMDFSQPYAAKVIEEVEAKYDTNGLLTPKAFLDILKKHAGPKEFHRVRYDQ